MADTTTVIPDRVLDLTGECCPYPPIFTMQEIADMRPGEILEVIVDHPPSIDNVPKEVLRQGHQVVAPVQRRGAVFHLFFQVGGGKRP